MPKRPHSAVGGGSGTPFRLSNKQYWSMRRRLELEGKWDSSRNPDNVPTRPVTPIIEFEQPQDISPRHEQQLGEALDQEETRGKLQFMSLQNEQFSDLSDHNYTMSLKCNEREIPKTDSDDSGSNMESSDKADGVICNSNFPIFHERRNFSAEIEQVEGSYRGFSAAKYAGYGGGTSGVSNPENYVRDNMLILFNDGLYKWETFKSTVNISPINVLQDYFQAYNSICVVIKCLPEFDKFNTSLIFDTLRKHIQDPFVLISERSAEGILHWHMLWLTSKRTDNAKRLLQKFLTPVSKHFSISCQQTKSFRHILRYILKEPIVLAVANSKHLSEYCFALCSEEVVYKPKTVETSDNKMINSILKIMKEHFVYTTEELMKVCPEIMVQFLHKSNLDSIVQNCKMFLLKPSDTWGLLTRITSTCPPDANFFRIYAYLMYQNINPTQFILDFFNIFCKFTDKRNVFCIQGPSNAGKTTFIRPLLEMLSFGEVVSGGCFMFQNCINKELLIWEEPLIGSDFIEMCKRVFEGMQTQVPIKFKSPQTLYRTPLLITTNKDLWHYSDADQAAIENRCVIYQFTNDAAGFCSLPASWWKRCFTNYCGDCREYCEYVTGCYPEYSASFELLKPNSTEQRPEPSESDGRSSEQLYSKCKCCGASCEPVDIGASQDPEW